MQYGRQKPKYLEWDLVREIMTIPKVLQDIRVVLELMYRGAIVSHRGNPQVTVLYGPLTLKREISLMVVDQLEALPYIVTTPKGTTLGPLVCMDGSQPFSVKSLFP